MEGIHMAVTKVGELGKPGSPNHAVEYEAQVSRRQLFRFIVPFLVASVGIGAEKVVQHDIHSQLDDGQSR
jgi:hypothetical protein